MRFIDEVIQYINEHPSISPIHKLILVKRVETWPSEKELFAARKELGYAIHEDTLVEVSCTYPKCSVKDSVKNKEGDNGIRTQSAIPYD